jgi:hypothetical protein
MLMADFGRLSNGGAMAPIGRGVWVTSVSARLRFFGRETLVVCIVRSRRAWSRCRTSTQLSKLSCLISDDRVHCPKSSLSSLLITCSVSSSSSFVRIIAQTLARSSTLYLKAGLEVQTFDRQWCLAVFISVCASDLSRWALWFFCE